ncbi:unnamed protein product, partial [Prorocentrum cordatum]
SPPPGASRRPPAPRRRLRVGRSLGGAGVPCPSQGPRATSRRRPGQRPPMAGAPLRLLCLAAACGTAARALEAPSSLEVLGRLKAFRAAGVSVFQTASEQLGTAGATREAERVSKWMLVLPPSQNWLSVLGVNKGLTGLAKDFVINYLGRSAYHDKNGKLIDNIKSVSTAFPRSNNVDDYAIKAIQSAVLKVCREGKNLFSDDGSLHLMLSELEDIIKDPTVLPHFQTALKTNAEVKNMFDYLSGPAPTKSEEL